MSILNDIKELFIDELLDKSNLKTFTLKEIHSSGQCQEVHFKNSNNNILVYKLDQKIKKNGSILDRYPFFKVKANSKNCAHKMCDYLIFYLRDDVLYVFVCELKSGNVDGAISQIIAGRHFSEFFINILKRCKDSKVEYKLNQILFSERPKKAGITTTNNKFNIPIQEVLCGVTYNLDSFAH